MLQIKTTKLQEMMTRVVKGVGDNKLIPLTGLIAIELKDGKLTIISTDATNYLYVKTDASGDDFYVVVEADTFSKLISRMTSEDTTLEVVDKSLEVKGNGKYKIPLPLDVDGGLIKYPNPMENDPVTDKLGDIQLSTIRAILSTVKPALAITMETPCFTGYYMSDIIVGTDSVKVTSMNTKTFDTPKLISSDMMELIGVSTDDIISVYSNGDKIVFDTDNCTVYGTVMSGIEDYPIEPIKGLLNQSFDSMCKIPKSAILQLLDRINLFVGEFDDGAISLTFTHDGLMVESTQSDGVEVVKYIESTNFKDFVCKIDIEVLRTQIKSQRGDSIELWYGDESAIKLVDGNITSIAALLV